MRVDVILQDYVNRFRRDFELDKLKDDKVFESFAAYCLIRKYYEEEFEPDEFRVGGPYDLGIDAAVVMVNGALCRTPSEVSNLLSTAGRSNVHFIIVQAKLPNRFAGAAFTTLATNLKHVFGAPPIPVRHSQDVKRLRECAAVVYANINKLARMPTIAAFYAAPGNPNLAALDPARLDAVKQLEATNRFSHVEMAPVGTSELRDLYLRADQSVNASIVTVNFMDLPLMPNVDEALIGIVTAREFVDEVLANPTGQMRHALFLDNLREFQQLDNDVNKEIQDTLQDADRRQRFAVMNNGVTIVARALVRNGKRLHLRDLKIVNGCQTSYVLMYERPNLTDDVLLSIRVIVTRDSEAVSDVIRATNRQTMVKGIEFESRKEFHRLIEQFLLAQEPTQRLYYERRSGQYWQRNVNDESGVTNDADNQSIQRTRIIRPKNLARAFSSIFLHEAWKANHLSENDESQIFGRVIDPMPYYASAAMLYRIDYLLRNKKIPQAYASAKYHLMAAARFRLLGDDNVLSSGIRRKTACDKILDLVWDSDKAEYFFDQLTGILTEARNATRPDGNSELDATLVASKDFGDHVKRITLATS